MRQARRLKLLPIVAQAAKPAAQPSPPSVDFSVEQFTELMEQIDAGGILNPLGALGCFIPSRAKAFRAHRLEAAALRTCL